MTSEKMHLKLPLAVLMPFDFTISRFWGHLDLLRLGPAFDFCHFTKNGRNEEIHMWTFHLPFRNAAFQLSEPGAGSGTEEHPDI